MPDSDHADVDPELIHHFADRGVRMDVERAPDGARWLLQRPAYLAAVVALADSALAAQLDFVDADYSPTRLLDELWRERESDLSVRIPWREAPGGEPIEVLLLGEHQSQPEPLITPRVLFHQGRVWDKERLAGAGARGTPCCVCSARSSARCPTVSSNTCAQLATAHGSTTGSWRS